MPCILTRCRAFVLSRCNTAPYKRLQRVFAVSMQFIPPTSKNSAQGFTATFHAVAPAQPPTIPDRHNKPLYRLRDAGGHTSAAALQRIPDTTATPDAVQVSVAAYYNKVYKRVQGCAPVVDPCQTVQHIADHASSGGSTPTVCGSLASVTPGAPAEGSAPPPVQGQPGGVSMLPTPGGLQSGTGSAVRAGGLAPSTRRGSPATGSAAGGAEPLAATAASLFGLSPDSQ